MSAPDRTDPVAATDAPSPREERKVVTVLAGDVVGSTALAGRLDPEDARLVVGGAVERMVTVVEELGGTVKDLAGDGIFALFGAPVTHEDDPERAVRAALRILCEIDGYAREVERGWGIQGFAVRIGVATGPAVLGSVGAGSRREYGATGDVANVAARLQTAADPGTVLVESSTARLVEPAFAWGDPRWLALKGKDERVTAIPAVSAVDAATRPRVGTAAPFVGRDAELAAAWVAFDDVLAGSGGVLFVTGEAGIGKSRLLGELRGRFEASESPGGPPTWLEGRCVSYGEATPYGPFADLFRAWLRVPSDAPDLRARIALRREVDRLIPGGGAELVACLGTMLGLSLDADAAAAIAPLAPEALQRGMRDAAGDVLSRLAEAGPVAVVLDDVQWADPTSVQLAEHLVPLADRAAMLLVISGRSDRDHPSYRLREAALREFPHRVREVSMEAMAGDVDDRLLTALVGEGTLPDQTRTRLREAAAGNPFFLEELVRSLQDAGALERSDRGWRFDAAVAVPVPETVQKVILARMDRLSPTSHDLLTAAAVLGRQFAAPLLEAVAGAGSEVDASLVELQRLDLVRESRRWPEREYRFKHPLIQETAYRSLLGDRRRELHRRAAAALEASVADGAEEGYAVLARHLREAGDVAGAIDRYARAGDAAARLFAVEEALGHYSTALDLADVSRAGASIAADLHLRRGRVASDAGRLPEAGADFEGALRIARASGDVGLEVASLEELGAYQLISGGGMGEGGPILDEALRAAEAADDVAAQVRVLARTCIGLSNELRFAEALQRGERALALARESGDEGLLARAMDGVKTVAAHVGDFDLLRTVRPELEDILRRRDDLWYLQWTLHESSFEPAARGRWEEASRLAEEALEVNRRIGDRADEPYFLATLGEHRRARGDYASALELGRRAVDLALELDRGWWTGWSESLFASTLLDVFAVDDAMVALQRGLRAAERTGTRQYVVRCLALLSLANLLIGDHDGANAMADRAEGLLREVTTPPGRAYLKGAPAYVAVAEVRLAAGEPDRAEHLAAPLLEVGSAAGWAEAVATSSLITGRCRSAVGDRRGAEAAFDRAREVAAGGDLPGTEWRSHAALADLCIEGGGANDARRHLIEARAIVERLAARLTDPGMQSRFRLGAARVIEGSAVAERR